MHSFVGTGLTDGRQNLERYERITVEIYTDDEVRRMIRDGTLHDGKTLATLAIYWLGRQE